MWISNCLLLQADVFSFGVILYEIFVGEITSQMVVGPTGDAMAAELYASKVIITSPPILTNYHTNGNLLQGPFTGDTSPVHAPAQGCSTAMLSSLQPDLLMHL
jgi:hypothetical protein